MSKNLLFYRFSLVNLINRIEAHIIRHREFPFIEIPHLMFSLTGQIYSCNLQARESGLSFYLYKQMDFYSYRYRLVLLC